MPTIAADLDVQPTIDPEQEVARRVGFLRDYLTTTGARGYVLAVSGGQDSTLAGRLVPLRTKDEVRASLETHVVYVVEVPAKHANVVKE